MVALGIERYSGNLTEGCSIEAKHLIEFLRESLFTRIRLVDAMSRFIPCLDHSLPRMVHFGCLLPQVLSIAGFPYPSVNF